MQVINTRQMFDKFVAECRECAEGKRAGVYISTRIANGMGLQLASLTGAATVLGLKVEGRRGVYQARKA